MGLIWVNNARYVKDYILEVEFNDGLKKKIDFQYLLSRKPFASLKNLEVFRNFKLDSWTVTWDNGNIDIAPESLYLDKWQKVS